MANSLCFGLALATVLVLVLVPAFFWIYGRLVLGYPADSDGPGTSVLSEPATEGMLVNQTDAVPDAVTIRLTSPQ